MEYDTDIKRHPKFPNVLVKRDGTAKLECAVAWNKGGKGNAHSDVLYVNVHDGKGSKINVAWSVYTLFIEEIPKGKRIYHKDGNPYNNHADNLTLTPLKSVIKSTDVEDSLF